MENPKKQGYYHVTLKGTKGAPPQTLVAAWKALDKKAGKCWYQLVAPDNDPTQDKVLQPLEGVESFVPAKREDIEALLRTELTLEERIQESYAEYVSSNKLWGRHRYPVPGSRKLEVGQSVLFGALKDGRVVALHEDGQAVTFTCTFHTRDGVVPDIRTAYWLDVFAEKDVLPTSLFDCPRYARIQPSNGSLGDLVSRVWQHGLKDNPDYQRGYVWTPDDEARFLESVFTGKLLGSFIFLRHDYSHLEEIFDGKQRLTTMIRLVSGQISYKGVFWHQMSNRDRREVENRNVPHTTLPGKDFSRAELLQMFLDTNAAGVPQTEEHLAKVRGLLVQELSRPCQAVSPALT